MRQELIKSIKSLAPNTVRISEELPYLESGVELFLKNPKTIYVGEQQIDTDPVFLTLDGLNISNQINSIRIYFTTDAKNPIFGYSDLVRNLHSLKDTIDLEGSHTRQALVETRTEGDLLVTEIEYRLIRLN